MIENILTQAMELLSRFSDSDVLRGFLGIVLFGLSLYVITLFPRTLRQGRAFWVVQIFLLPCIFLVAISILKFILDGVGITNWFNEPDYVTSVGLTLIAAYLLNRAVDLFFWNGVLRHKASGVPQIIKTVVTFLIYIVCVYIIIAVIYGQPLTGLVISSGVLLGVLGLAFQPVLGDIIAGISLTVDRPFKPGDLIELEGGQRGWVLNTDWRATRIKTQKDTVYVIPNGQLSNTTILNYDEPNSVYGFWFYIPVARSVSPKLVMQLLLEAAIKSPNVLDDPQPIVRVSDVDSQPIRYLVHVRAANFDMHFRAKSEILQNAWELFDRAGFTFAAQAIQAEFWQGEPAQGNEPRAEEALNEVQLLAPLSTTERQSLVDQGIIQRYSAGDPIVKQGDNGNSAYVVLSGLVRVHRTLEDEKRELELSRLGTFEFFGEMSLLTGAPRFASVTAHTDCQLLNIPKVCLQSILNNRPELADELAQLMAERKIKTEIMSSEAQEKSMSDILREYKAAFAQNIRGFFRAG